MGTDYAGAVGAPVGGDLGNATIDDDDAAAPSSDETDADPSGDEPTEES